MILEKKMLFTEIFFKKIEKTENITEFTEIFVKKSKKTENLPSLPRSQKKNRESQIYRDFTKNKTEISVNYREIPSLLTSSYYV